MAAIRTEPQHFREVNQWFFFKAVHFPGPERPRFHSFWEVFQDLQVAIDESCVVETIYIDVPVVHLQSLDGNFHPRTKLSATFSFKSWPRRKVQGAYLRMMRDASGAAHFRLVAGFSWLKRKDLVLPTAPTGSCGGPSGLADLGGPPQLPVSLWQQPHWCTDAVLGIADI